MTRTGFSNRPNTSLGYRFFILSFAVDGQVLDRLFLCAETGAAPLGPPKEKGENQ